MAYGHSFSHVTTFSVPRDQWPRLQPLLESWKALLQDLPGLAGSDVTAHQAGNGDLRCHIRVSWLYREQLDEFLESEWETGRLISRAQAGLYDVHAEKFEHFI